MVLLWNTRGHKVLLQRNRETGRAKGRSHDRVPYHTADSKFVLEKGEISWEEEVKVGGGENKRGTARYEGGHKARSNPPTTPAIT
jgi:hypothetical protein